MVIEEYLRTYNIKVTKARINIIQIIMDSSSAISAEDIYSKCKGRDFQVDLSTVYRTLEIFEEKGIIIKFHVGDNRYNYLLKEKGHKHIIQCDLCHKTVEYDCPMPQIKELLKKEIGFTVTCGDITLNGICDKCKKNKNN